VGELSGHSAPVVDVAVNEQNGHVISLDSDHVRLSPAFPLSNPCFAGNGREYHVATLVCTTCVHSAEGHEMVGRCWWIESHVERPKNMAFGHGTLNDTGGTDISRRRESGHLVGRIQLPGTWTRHGVSRSPLPVRNRAVEGGLSMQEVATLNTPTRRVEESDAKHASHSPHPASPSLLKERAERLVVNRKKWRDNWPKYISPSLCSSLPGRARRR